MKTSEQLTEEDEQRRLALLPDRLREVGRMLLDADRLARATGSTRDAALMAVAADALRDDLAKHVEKLSNVILSA